MRSENYLKLQISADTGIIYYQMPVQLEQLGASQGFRLRKKRWRPGAQESPELQCYITRKAAGFICLSRFVSFVGSSLRRSRNIRS